MSDKNISPITIALSGRIDSGNAAETEKEINKQLSSSVNAPVILDASNLLYISSAGLRVILRIKKAHSDLTITDVSSEVYEILEMTGFTEIIKVEKAYRTVSVEGCEVIGEGFNGKVYRIDKDNVVKTYKNADALSEIQHERKVAKLALILGVPTAISYDVVRVGESYGSVFELLNSRSFSKILAGEPEKFDWCVSEYVKMLKKIHSIVVPKGELPSIKEKTLRSVMRMKDSLPDGLGDKLVKMIEDIPESDHMVHGDFHTKNIVLAGDEVLVIDMDTISVGHPIFDFIHMYDAYVGFSEYDPGIVLDFQGYSSEISRKFWHSTLMSYLGTEDEKRFEDVDKKVRCLAYAGLIDWGIRHPDPDPQKARATIDLWKTRLIEILGEINTLNFDLPAADGANELQIDAITENLEKVIDFVNKRLEAVDCSPKNIMQLDIAVEEIFVNIANYAYSPEIGTATVKVEVSDAPVTVTVTFTDNGVPYDPLKKADPDVSLSAEKREIGGLGIFLTKKVIDDISYEYKNGSNILTIKKTV
jgi:uncharacterized protein (TIGR02172 family)